MVGLSRIIQGMLRFNNEVTVILFSKMEKFLFRLQRGDALCNR